MPVKHEATRPGETVTQIWRSFLSLIWFTTLFVSLTLTMRPWKPDTQLNAAKTSSLSLSGTVSVDRSSQIYHFAHCSSVGRSFVDITAEMPLGKTLNHIWLVVSSDFAEKINTRRQKHLNIAVIWQRESAESWYLCVNINHHKYYCFVSGGKKRKHSITLLEFVFKLHQTLIGKYWINTGWCAVTRLNLI